MRLKKIAFAGSLMLAVSLAPLSAFASLVGSLSTPAGSGIVGGGNWTPEPTGQGYQIEWDISQNGDGSWRYKYILSDQGGDPLSPATSHIIFQLSENILPSDLFNFAGDISMIVFGDFGPASANPGFPAGESIFGVKFDLAGNQRIVEFDSNRQPMWGDYYAKGGSSSFAYNTDLGVAVANANNYLDTPVDALGRPLHKILVPDTLIPEPVTLACLGLGGLLLRRRLVV